MRLLRFLALWRRREPSKGYKVKVKPIGNPDDPVWQAIEEMRLARLDVMRKCLETGERYRDPFEDRFRRDPAG